MNARLSLAIALGLFLGLTPLAAQAQKISFSFGHYGHGHHHHHHCWDDPWYWGPHYDYVYVAPPPVVRREIRYVQPVERVIETRELAPREIASPASDSVARAATQTPLQLWNSGGQKVPVAFLVDGQQVTLHDGQSHTFYGSGAKLVEFDRGGDFGTTRRSLTGNRYEFVITDRGWDLVRQGEPAAVTTAATPRNELPGAIRR
jgi:hypothetical protein